MLPKTHILINLGISLILLFFLPPFGVLIFFLSSFLIDVDHYLYYVAIKKRFSLKSAYNWFTIRRNKLMQLSYKERKKHKHCILIFHGIELIIILGFFTKFSPPLIYVLFGFITHLLEDLIVEYKSGVLEHKLSLIYAIYDHLLKKKLKHISD